VNGSVRPVSEDLVIAVWRAPGVDLDACRTRLRDEWAAEAMEADGDAGITISFALDDQGAFGAAGTAPDALVALGLERAHDLDDIPARDHLHALARRVEAWRVDTRRPREWERTWPDGEAAPGVKLVVLLHRAEHLSRQQFVRHWTEVHTPLELEHHAGLWRYTQSVVRRAYTPGGGQVDGISELYFRTRADFDERLFDSDAGRDALFADAAKFIGGADTALMSEIPVR
jgi:uncharacterized protein (TIGR02118 family)